MGTIVKIVIVGVLTFAKSIFSVQQPEYMSAPCSVSFALVADSTESNVIIEKSHQLRRYIIICIKK